MNTAVSTRNGSGQPPVIDRELVRRTVAKDATNDELELYLYDCQRRNVHPLDKLLHFTKRGGRYTPVTSIDLMRSRAADTGQLAGSDDAIFETSGKTLILATVTVYRLTQGQRFAYTATARWNEYNAGGPMWQKMPHTMLAKCAEALALRKAFPQELAGLYSGEEMEQAVEAPPVASGRDPVPRHDPDHLSAAEGIEARVVDQRADYDALQKEMRTHRDPVRLQEWGATVAKERMGSYRKSWQNDFRREYWDYLQELRAQNRAAHDPETGEVSGGATGVLAEIENVLSMVTDPGMLERTWEFQCAPRIEPHMYDDAMAIYQEHERRLGRD